jgi:hypothetical protein
MTWLALSLWFVVVFLIGMACGIVIKQATPKAQPKQRVIELATLNVNGYGQEQLEDFSLNGQLYRFLGVTFKQIGNEWYDAYTDKMVEPNHSHIGGWL